MVSRRIDDGQAKAKKGVSSGGSTSFAAIARSGLRDGKSSCRPRRETRLLRSNEEKAAQGAQGFSLGEAAPMTAARDHQLKLGIGLKLDGLVA
jgi:hypothetical protein